MVEQPKKVVWIKCRARKECEGNQAVEVFQRANAPVSVDGGFEPNAGGRSIRYRCLTCNGTFHVHN